MTRTLGSPTSMEGLRRGVGFALAVVLSGLAASPSAQASPVTPTQFATFGQTAGSPLTWTNTGGTNPGGTLFTATAPITFSFTLPGAPTGPIAATLDITASSNTAATSATTTFPAPFGSVTLLDQALDGTTNTLRITDTTPAHHNLLTLTFTGDIKGLLNSPNGSLQGDSVANPATIVSYSSDYLNFGSGSAGTYNIGLSGITNTGGGTGLQISSINGFLESFTAGAQGAFTSTSVTIVPAPASVAMLGTAGVITPLGLFLSRRMRRAKPVVA
jgi:hypothetical protein